MSLGASPLSIAVAERDQLEAAYIAGFRAGVLRVAPLVENLSKLLAVGADAAQRGAFRKGWHRGTASSADAINASVDYAAANAETEIPPCA